MMDPNIQYHCCKHTGQVLESNDMQRDQEAILDCLAMIKRPFRADQDIPVAAKIWHPEHGWLAHASNTSRQACDATAHAEINVIRQACAKLRNYRLPGCTLYVTLEPCMMCFSAILEARISRIVFAASDRKLGVLSQGAYRSHHASGNHHFSWTGGVCGHEASMLLQEFFRLICR